MQRTQFSFGLNFRFDSFDLTYSQFYSVVNVLELHLSVQFVLSPGHE